jgi:hypothetical protein
MKDLIIIFLLIILAIWIFWPVFNPSSEQFYNDWKQDSTPQNWPQYGLRGDLLRTESIDPTYISPYTQMRLSASGGQMTASSTSPPQEMFAGCIPVACPYYDQLGNSGYDNMDTCWKCPVPGDNQPWQFLRYNYGMNQSCPSQNVF